MAALFIVLFVVALVIVLFALLPRVADNATPPYGPPMAGQNVAPTDIAQFPHQERLPEALPPEPPPPEQIPIIPPPEDEPVAQLPPQIPVLPPAVPPVEVPYATREQGIFLVQVENDGADLRLARVNRTLRVSDTPLMDSLNALLLGPTAEESAHNMVSLISPDTRILSVRVEGYTVGNVRRDTAYINLNESFQFNPHGPEGLRYQIWQIVYTATEFFNVHDVQILIEGNRVDFLHEGGVRIGSPIGR